MSKYSLGKIMNPKPPLMLWHQNMKVCMVYALWVALKIRKLLHINHFLKKQSWKRKVKVAKEVRRRPPGEPNVATSEEDEDKVIFSRHWPRGCNSNTSARRILLNPLSWQSGLNYNRRTRKKTAVRVITCEKSPANAHWHRPAGLQGERLTTSCKIKSGWVCCDVSESVTQY